MFKCEECKAVFDEIAELRHLLVKDPYEIFDTYYGCPFCGGEEINEVDEA